MQQQAATADVLAIAARAGIAVGKTVDVLRLNEHINGLPAQFYAPMIRKLTSVEVQTKGNADWLLFHWDRAGNTPWGTADCGGSGHMIDADLIAALEQLAAAQQVAA